VRAVTSDHTIFGFSPASHALNPSKCAVFLANNTVSLDPARGERSVVGCTFLMVT
jgi:hypothetical protein